MVQAIGLDATFAGVCRFLQRCPLLDPLTLHEAAAALRLSERALCELVRRRGHFRPDVQALLRFARTPAFAERAARLGDYDVRRLGAVLLHQ